MHPVLGTVLTARMLESHSPQFKDTASFGPGTAKAAWNDSPMPERGRWEIYVSHGKGAVAIKRTTPVDGKVNFMRHWYHHFFTGYMVVMIS